MNEMMEPGEFIGEELDQKDDGDSSNPEEIIGFVPA